jgi:anti-sigma-K factor RskA
MDAFAYVIELLEAGERYFTGANDQTDEQYASEVDKELSELEAEYDDVKPLQGWRVA